jgi:zinc-binding in reverse transcriptase
MLKLSPPLSHYVRFGMRACLSLTSLVGSVQLWDKKKLSYLIFFIYYNLLMKKTQHFGYESQMAFIPLSLCITFYIFEALKLIFKNLFGYLKFLLNISFFLWMELHNKNLNKDNLKKRGWLGDQSCLFCFNSESVDHLFFHCPFIIDFCTRLLNSHPQRRHLRVSSLLDFFNSYLFLSTFHFWGTILAACIWIIWLERNKRIFTASPRYEDAILYHHVLYLYHCWTCTTADMMPLLGVAAGLTLPHLHPTSSHTSGASPFTDPQLSVIYKYEDLLDWKVQVFVGVVVFFLLCIFL